MSKSTLYVTARSGGRPPKADVQRAVELFVSTGSCLVPAAVAAEVINHCFTKKFNVMIGERDSGLIYLERH